MTDRADDELEATIPLPVPTDLSAPHWDGCREGVLRVQRCRSCGEIVFIPRPLCTACQSTDLEWIESTGRGVVYSHTTVGRPPRPEFEAPYVVAIVELEEGWHMLTNVVDCAPDEVHVGQAVEVTFEAVTEEITLPRFRPAG